MRPNEILDLLRSLEKNPGQLNKRHLKKIYALLIAMGHYPVCPWCKEYIYDINDFTWDHIVPKVAGGKDSLENLQPMHKRCNNAVKGAHVYQMDYHYDIRSELENVILDVRVSVCKKASEETERHKDRYKNDRVQRKSRRRR